MTYAASQPLNRPVHRGAVWTLIAAVVLVAGTVLLAGCKQSDLLRPMIVSPYFSGQGDFTLADGYRFEGEFRDGVPDGLGTWIYADGSNHDGEFRHGRLHGHGTFTGANGEHYEGDYRHGKPHGRGIWTEADGSRWEGEFRNGEPYGLGTWTSPDGDTGEPVILDTFPVLPEIPQIEWSIWAAAEISPITL